MVLVVSGMVGCITVWVPCESALVSHIVSTLKYGRGRLGLAGAPLAWVLPGSAVGWSLGQARAGWMRENGDVRYTHQYKHS